jgi:hypothetical protein
LRTGFSFYSNLSHICFISSIINLSPSWYLRISRPLRNSFSSSRSISSKLYGTMLILAMPSSQTRFGSIKYISSRRFAHSSFSVKMLRGLPRMSRPLSFGIFLRGINFTTSSIIFLAKLSLVIVLGKLSNPSEIKFPDKSRCLSCVNYGNAPFM